MTAAVTPRAAFTKSLLPPLEHRRVGGSEEYNILTAQERSGISLSQMGRFAIHYASLGKPNWAVEELGNFRKAVDEYSIQVLSIRQDERLL